MSHSNDYVDQSAAVDIQNNKTPQARPTLSVSSEARPQSASSRHTLSGILAITALVGALATIFFPSICEPPRHGDGPALNDVGNNNIVAIDRTQDLFAQNLEKAKKKARIERSRPVYYAYRKRPRNI
jgi:hypothetical protein